MDRYREKSSRFFTSLADGLHRNLHRAVVPLSKSLGSPAPQTSLSTGSRITSLDGILNVNLSCSIFPVFELPDELILSILSHVSRDPQLTGHYARFRVQYTMWMDDYHEQRVRFLLPLSMTCRTMRLRLLPWIWERLECLEVVSASSPNSEGGFPRGFSAIMRVLRMDIFLAASVKYFRAFLLPGLVLIHVLQRFMSVGFMWGDTNLPPFIRCLESLQNLHTLEIGLVNESITTPLKNALEGIKLPQIKTLILHPATYPLLQCCYNVEDVVCVVRDATISSDEFLGSLASNRDSKVRRLAIPLFSWGNPSRK